MYSATAASTTIMTMRQTARVVSPSGFTTLLIRRRRAVSSPRDPAAARFLAPSRGYLAGVRPQGREHAMFETEEGQPDSPDEPTEPTPPEPVPDEAPGESGGAEPTEGDEGGSDPEQP
jgi:hypothetical protein